MIGKNVQIMVQIASVQRRAVMAIAAITSILLLIPALLSGCRNQGLTPLYSHYEIIGDAHWNMDDEVFFSIPVEEVSRHYSITGVVRIVPNCRLKSIPIGIVEEDYRGAIKTSTIHCALEKENAVGSGYNLREYRFPIDTSRIFGRKGIHTISFRHLLQDSIASGIVEIGVLVEALDK